MSIMNLRKHEIKIAVEITDQGMNGSGDVRCPYCKKEYSVLTMDANGITKCFKCNKHFKIIQIVYNQIYNTYK